MSSDPILQPYQLKHLTLRNRVMLTSHEPAYAEDGMPKDRYRAYHVARAKAGVALTMTAGSALVSRDSPPAFSNLLAWKDEIVPWMRALTEECHDHGAAVMIQLTHLGWRTRWDQGDWLPVVSSSGRREPAHRATPKRLEDWDIARIIRDYADAAERMQAAGLDGIELESYGHLMDAFWSPLNNDLDGPYGGADLDHRMRFCFDVLRAIRDRVGPDFIVGIRYVADDQMAGGITRADGMAITQKLRQSGLVDFLNVIRGHIDSDAALTGVIPVQGMASAPHLDFAGEIRAAAQIPTFHASRIPDVATARHAIASGKLDMVGMTRAHIADPDIIAKVLRGEEDRIRPCVGANYCLDRIYMGGGTLCLHNPATGRELDLPHDIPSASSRKRVVIVGAGPAGLEAARVAAARGHTVIVHEAANEAGGQVRLTALTARRREMASIIGWRLAECERLGVVIRYNSLADADMVIEDAPDMVIIATGGLPDTEIDGPGGALAVTAWDILSGDALPGRDVLIHDMAGDQAALQAAEKIAEAGGKVEIVTRDRTLSAEVMSMTLTPALGRLQTLGVTITPAWHVTGIAQRDNGLVATLGSDFADVTQDRVVDQVVVNNGTQPLDDVYFALRDLSVNRGEVDYDALIAGRAQEVRTQPEQGFALFRIGDAVASRNVHAAIHDALRLMHCN